MPETLLFVEIVIAEMLPERFEAWFEGMTLTAQSDRSTCISGSIADRAALHGLLERVRDLNLRLISVTVTEQPSS